MKTFRLIRIRRALFALGLVGLVGCVGAGEEDEGTGTTEAALCAGRVACEPGVPPSLSPPPRADLIAQIAGGFACPVGNGDTITVRIRNQGGADAGRFVVRTEVTVYTGSQYFVTRRHFLVSSLRAGASTTVGVNLGDGVDAAQGSDGLSTPIVSQQFVNRSGVFPSATVTEWRVLVDTSMGATWYPVGSTFRQISYPSNAVAESNESNNIISGTRSACGYPSGPVLAPR